MNPSYGYLDDYAYYESSESENVIKISCDERGSSESFYGLPVSVGMLYKNMGIDSLYEWQTNLLSPDSPFLQVCNKTSLESL